MDLQTRKLNAIQYLAGVKDENVLSKIEAIIEEVQQPSFTKEQLIERAKRSSEDYASGKFMTQEQLEQDAEKW